ncbi:DUF2269 family protein [Verminephrobacter aporrectodeae subsp. tuberculatae]|uniref:DUF2269 family protein n=1 Tax=Verminephrobacter aporrectodeae TaxID=1110389 RepID=UPI002243B26F|nr:DUF2269 family protein [Verminephrobacter aporrectodeae]MCW8165002.1 DUF2269 family protein [Verminephrobacter aporrectodeae subsp. tuberculatae]MCW8168355.1 DUF2269 family protein [Verminephrobacter aporrectodeae subsp. tuberculatae]
MEQTRWWLALHILGCVIFLGNTIVTFFWKLMAGRSRDPKVLAFSQRLVTLTDKVFTAVGAALLAIGGYVHAWHLKLNTLQTPWIFWAQVCFYASAAIWVAVLVPIQHKQGKLAEAFGVSGEIPAAYWRLASRWNAMGTLATTLLIVALLLMVVK